MIDMQLQGGETPSPPGQPDQDLPQPKASGEWDPATPGGPDPDEDQPDLPDPDRQQGDPVAEQAPPRSPQMGEGEQARGDEPSVEPPRVGLAA